MWLGIWKTIWEFHFELSTSRNIVNLAFLDISLL